MQPNKVNMNEMDYGRWNEWDGLWVKGNKNEEWSMKCGLKEMRWKMNNKGNDVTSPSLSLTTLQAGQIYVKHSLSFFLCLFIK